VGVPSMVNHSAVVCAYGWNLLMTICAAATASAKSFGPHSGTYIVTTHLCKLYFFSRVVGMGGMGPNPCRLRS